MKNSKSLIYFLFIFLIQFYCISNHIEIIFNIYGEIERSTLKSFLYA